MRGRPGRRDKIDAMASERGRIEFLLRRDGLAATVEWVRRTTRIYRRAVLGRQGYGREYRHILIAAYCEFKRWLGPERLRE